MSFIYPRTVTIKRPIPETEVGAVAYGGVTQCEETVLFTGVPCSIQHKSMSGAIPVHLPADVADRSMWKVFIPLSAGIPNGAIKDRDIVIDDLGWRMQVSADYWNSLGYALLCERLEA